MHNIEVASGHTFACLISDPFNRCDSILISTLKAGSEFHFCLYQ
jgi:hypothetical protein